MFYSRKQFKSQLRSVKNQSEWQIVVQQHYLKHKLLQADLICWICANWVLFIYWLAK